MHVPRTPASNRLRALRPLVAGLAVLGLLAALPGTSAAAPPTPSNLPQGIEVLQPYVGQSSCDPVAKPGVRAFANMLLNTYKGTSSLGIVRDCGAGGTSEHKEGRAFDWGVNVYNTTQRAQATDLLTWLTRKDAAGNDYAMARRLGIMYMIWNKQIWKAYDAGRGWQAYNGPNPHTDHVHFSFGWNGAKQATSYWTGRVAPLDYGPGTAPTSSVVPVPHPNHIAILRAYGDLTLTQGSSGNPVATVQSALKITADGAYGSGTAKAVADFQRSQGVPVSGSFGPSDWRRLFPPPITPFGNLDTVRVDLQTVHVAGWAIDADSLSNVRMDIYVNGRGAASVTANAPRTDVERIYPEWGSDVGFRTNLTLDEGTNQVCVYAINTPGTEGAHDLFGCRTVVVRHSPLGSVAPTGQLPASPNVDLRGWSYDPNVLSPSDVHVHVNGRPHRALRADQPNSTVQAAGTPEGRTGDHGFVGALTLPEGRQDLCVYGINVAGTPGRHTLHGCKTVSVRHRPAGSLDSLSLTPGAVVARGWAYDPDSPGATSIRFDVDGRAVKTAPTSFGRSDIARLYPGQAELSGYGVALTGLQEGVRRICATAVNAAGTPGVDISLGCRSIAVRTTPVGVLDVPRTTPGDQPDGKTVVTGWALDPDTTGAIGVHVRVDGRLVAGTSAQQPDSRSTSAWSAYGDRHGYRFELDLSEGSHRICTYGLNAPGTPGGNPELGCRTVTVRHTPSGVLDAPRTTPGDQPVGTTVVTGWALDPDTTNKIGVHVRVNGRLVAGTSAGGPDARSTGVWPVSVYGSRHGYRFELELAEGTHRICTYGLNAPGTPGGNPELGCRTVTVKHSPTGQLEVLRPLKPGVLRTGGWSVDPDTAASTWVHVYVDGRLARAVPATLPSAAAARTWPGYGDRHGFAVDLTVSPGRHTVCAYGINVSGTPGGNAGLGCRTATAE